ncbi:S1-C subfamily serine protease [Glaciihabitans tibetensis]|uniref:S1-C subfamily serine protease n=1 Tax=Glaciihabitans tibetensis TaxID=1266600 RepID=A0A2T0VHJ6_9MICO|nr:trypsin-like peptidase domain-containing protein [Glaciihabitans tibetensis]PRY69688.1 S1-C subfamily serine protease [Glaciihabitans tibetensis]
MDQNNTPTEPDATPADSSAAASDAARIAAVADAEAANAVRAAEAAMARAVSARAALAQADAARAAAVNAASAQTAAAEAAAAHAAVVRASLTGAETPAAAQTDVVGAASTPQPAPVVGVTPAPPAPDAMTTQKVFYNSSPYAAPQAGAGVPPAAPTNAKPSAFRRHSVGLLVGGAAAIAIGLGGGGYALGTAITASNASTSSAITTPDTTSPDTTTPDTTTPNTTTPDTTPDTGEYLPTMPFGGSGRNPSLGQGTTGTDSSTDATAATAEQTEGVVTIVSTLYYDEATRAAGTGVILTSNGQILTNNHVIEGATSIAVTVESTGETYTATVVGTDSTNDIALLQLDDASGLDVVSTDDSELSIGDDATSVGNAEGTGDLVAAAGTITALNESITVGNEYTGAEESLSGLIEIDADVVSGDSGGPLVDADGEVVGIVTAASSGSTNITGYAIPIETALDIVSQIESGEETATVQIGLPAFLGVQLATTQQSAGVAVGGVITGTPAETAGLAAGDVITAVDGTAVSTADALSDLIAGHDAGDSVIVSYTDASGAAQQTTVTLTEGPAA